VASPAHFAGVAADAGAGRFVWVAGLAEMHAPGYFALGATGFTSGLANVDPSTSLGLWRALTDSDRDSVAAIFERLRPFEELRTANAGAYNVSVVKEALCQLGMCGRGVRPPSSPVPEETRARIAELLELWGLLR